MILDHETPDEKAEARYTAEQQLDRIYHAIPEWVNRTFPQHTIAERIVAGFESQQKSWHEAYLSESKEREKMTAFALYLCKTKGFDFMNEYWNFLISKDLERAKTEEEKRVLTKMRKPV